MREIEGPSHLGKGWSRFRNIRAPFDIAIVLGFWAPAVVSWIFWRAVKAVGATGGVLELFSNIKLGFLFLASPITFVWLVWLMLWVNGTYDASKVGVPDNRTYKEMQ